MSWSEPDDSGVMRNGQYSIKLLGKDQKIPVFFRGMMIGRCNNIKKAQSLVSYHINKRTGVT